jgi:hypothetical protein
MADESAEWEPTWLWLGRLGFLVFLAGLGLFCYQLWDGTDVIAGVAVNGVGAVLLIAWAAKDALSDPSTEGSTWSIAAGTSLFLYGLYLLGSGIAIAVTGVLVHERGTLGLLYIPLALVTGSIGFAIVHYRVEMNFDSKEGYETGDSDGEQAASANAEEP